MPTPKGYVFTEDRNYPFAYRYRDWVVQSLNDDLPYDQFLIQQLAADLLPRSDDHNLAALGLSNARPPVFEQPQRHYRRSDRRRSSAARRH